MLGFPSNDFGAQEPGTNEEIKSFCKRTYDVSFPMFSKVVVRGKEKIPLYDYLTSQRPGEIRWNFTKFLVGKDGTVLGRFESSVEPESAAVTSALEQALSK